MNIYCVYKILFIRTQIPEVSSSGFNQREHPQNVDIVI